MTTNIAAERGDFFERVSGVLAQARKDSRPESRTPLRRNSRRAGSCEASFWRSTSRQEVQKILKAAQRYELTGRERGRRNGPLGAIGLEVLALFANLVSFKTGRLDPSLDWIGQAAPIARCCCAGLEGSARAWLSGLAASFRADPERRPRPSGAASKQCLPPLSS